jgi:hypothetical protein
MLASHTYTLKKYVWVYLAGPMACKKREQKGKFFKFVFRAVWRKHTRDILKLHKNVCANAIIICLLTEEEFIWLKR